MTFAALEDTHAVQFVLCVHRSNIFLIMLHPPHLRIIIHVVISVGGLAAGVLYSAPNKKGAVPVMAAGVAGSIADLMSGLMGECQSEVSAYKESRGER